MNLANSSDQKEAKCQVCFACTLPNQQQRKMIRCKKCNRLCHRYCYLPSCLTSQFICDACQDEYKGVCCFCQNDGLFKRVDSKWYAHPVCLIYNQFSIVNSYEDLSFVLIDEIKALHGKSLCIQCKNINMNVLFCGCSCEIACHLYCAMKNQRSGDGWKILQNVCSQNSNFFDLFEEKINKYLHSKNPFLKKKLPIKKTSRKEPIIKIYCPEHSSTSIECKCNQVEIQQDGGLLDWIFCDECSQWQHLQCLVKIGQKKQIINSPTYTCIQCKSWKLAVESQIIEIPNELPKMHLCDFIWIQSKIEQSNFKSGLNIVKYCFRLPILPSKRYIQSEYRKYLVRILKKKIDMNGIKYQLQQLLKNMNDGSLLNNFMRIFERQRQKLYLIWWISECQLISLDRIQQPLYLFQLKKQNIKLYYIIDIINLLINFQFRFSLGQNQCLYKLKNRLQILQDNNIYSFSSKGKKLKDNDDGQCMKKKKIMQYFKNRLSQLLLRLKNAYNKEKVYQILGQFHDLISNQEISYFEYNLPKIPIVLGSQLFKDRQISLRYLLSVSFLQRLKIQWNRFNNNKFQQLQRSNQLKKRYIKLAQQNYNRLILQQKDDRLRYQLIRLWNMNQINFIIPSRQEILNQPQEIIFNINYQNLTRQKITLLLSQITQKNIYFSEKYRNSNIIKQLRILQKFLNILKNIKFTKTSLGKINNLRSMVWDGDLTQYIPKILDQFILIYNQTNKLLNEYYFNDSDCNNCLFSIWKLSQNNFIFDNYQIDRYIIYLKQIQNIRLQFFIDNVSLMIKKFIIKIIDRMQSRQIIFKNQIQYKLIKHWCYIFNLNPLKMGSIFQIDRTFQHKQSFIKCRFDDFLAIQQCEKILTNHLNFCKQYHLQFRYNQLKVMLTWIDLYNKIIQIVPSQYLFHPDYIPPFDQDHSLKPDFYALREILDMMNQIKFPKCQFLSKLTKLIEQGQQINSNINKILDLCNWSYQLNSQIQWQKKIPIEEFQKIRQKVMSCVFRFDAQCLQFDMLIQNFKSTESKIILLKSQRQKCSEKCYLQQKAKSIILELGISPIHSNQTKFLWNIIESQKIPGLPQNLQNYLIEVSTSNRIYCWQQLQHIKLQIQQKFENKFLKQDLCKRLSKLIFPNQLLYSKFKGLFQKFRQNLLFHIDQIEQLDNLLKEYQTLQFQDEDIRILKSKYEHYKTIKYQAKWRINAKIKDQLKIKFIVNSIANLHKSFFTAEIDRFNNYIKESQTKFTEKPITVKQTPIKLSNFILKNNYSPNMKQSYQSNYSSKNRSPHKSSRSKPGKPKLY